VNNPVGLSSIYGIYDISFLLDRLSYSISTTVCPNDLFHSINDIDIYEPKKCEYRKRSWCCRLSPVLFKLQSEYLTKEALEVFGDFSTGGQVIRNMKYADEEQMVLQGVIGRLIEIGKFCELENNWKNLR
jgi:hypothetical protein